MKEWNPPLFKYQSTGAIALSGCAFLANLLSIVHTSSLVTGSTHLDRIHNVAVHLEGCILSVVALGVEIEYVQLLSIASVFRSVLSRVFLYALIAALTYVSAKEFLYYAYIKFILISCLVNAGFYFFIWMCLLLKIPSRRVSDDAL